VGRAGEDRSMMDGVSGLARCCCRLEIVTVTVTKMVWGETESIRLESDVSDSARGSLVSCGHSC
jgi:hypothetical protein